MPVTGTPAGAGKEAAAEKDAAKSTTSATIAEIAAEAAGQTPEVQAPETATPPPGGEGPPEVEATPEPAKPEPQPEPTPTPKAPVDEDSVPTEYMGVDLSGLPAENRQSIIDEFKGKDRYITGLNERLAEERKQDGEPDAPVEEPPAPLSDDDLLKAWGLDPEDPMYEVQKEAVLPIAKTLQPHLQTLQVVAQKQFLQDTVEQWNADIDAMSSKFGALPEGVTHDDVLDFAVQNSITSPAEAYLHVTGSARQEIQAKATEARRQAVEALAEGKRAATTTRPRATVATTEKPLKGEKVRDVFGRAAQEAADELGMSWAEAVQADREP